MSTLPPSSNVTDPSTNQGQGKTFFAAVRTWLAEAFGTDSTPSAVRTALGAASRGANGDITSLTGLTTPLSKAQGGSGVATGLPQIQPVAASVASNALTVTLNPTTLDFRSATLSSGTVNQRSVAAAVSLVIPSGASLGTVSGQASRIALLAIDNAGTVELAAVNLAGGTGLDETGVISTTAISAAATSATAIYSATARTNVPYRVVGYVDSTQTTAGTWAAAPSTVQGCGGEAFSALQSLGYGQKWTDMFGSRSFGAPGPTYYNTTGRPIAVAANGLNTGTSCSIALIVGSVIVSYATESDSTINMGCVFSVFGIVPPGAAYRVDAGNMNFNAWAELR